MPFRAPDLPHLRRRMARRPAPAWPAGRVDLRAAVAAILRQTARGPELLLIRRAERAGDPWSGHMALPGGRYEPGDENDWMTAVRETREEVGIDLLAGGEYLGALDPVAPQATGASLAVQPFVWIVPPTTEAFPNNEVAGAHWVPLTELWEPGAAVEFLHHASGRRFPALQCRGGTVWGLTHRILLQLFQHFEGDPSPTSSL